MEACSGAQHRSACCVRLRLCFPSAASCSRYTETSLRTPTHQLRARSARGARPAMQGRACTGGTGALTHSARSQRTQPAQRTQHAQRAQHVQHRLHIHVFHGFPCMAAPVNLSSFPAMFGAGRRTPGHAGRHAGGSRTAGRRPASAPAAEAAEAGPGRAEPGGSRATIGWS